MITEFLLHIASKTQKDKKKWVVTILTWIYITSEEVKKWGQTKAISDEKETTFLQR